MDVDIIPFLEKIIDKTRNQACSWEKTSSDTYRLLLRNGSVTVQKGKEDPYLVMGSVVLYRLRLFDQADCFFNLDITTRGTGQYVMVDELYKSILDEENRVVNEKIASLLSELS